jgi:hypothetical protein
MMYKELTFYELRRFWSLLKYEDGPVENRLEPKLSRPGRTKSHFECLFDVHHFCLFSLQTPRNADFFDKFYKPCFWPNYCHLQLNH